MLKRAWFRQIQAVVYIVLILLLYSTLNQQLTYLDAHLPVKVGEKAVYSELPAAGQQEGHKEPEYDILIDLTQSMLYLFENNKLIKKYPIAQGKPDTPSPIGVWIL